MNKDNAQMFLLFVCISGESPSSLYDTGVSAAMQEKRLR